MTSEIRPREVASSGAAPDIAARMVGAVRPVFAEYAASARYMGGLPDVYSACHRSQRSMNVSGRKRPVSTVVMPPSTNSAIVAMPCAWNSGGTWMPTRSEEHTSELQSRGHHVCRLLLE